MAEQKLKAVAVEVPKQQRGGRTSTIPAEFVTECEALLADDKACSDGQLYHKKGNDEEHTHHLSRVLANSQQQKVKKAILNSSNNPYSDPKQLRARVWEQEKGAKYQWAIFPNPNYVAEGEGKDES